jgi:hypothetical protein
MSATKVKSYGDAGFVAGDIYDLPVALSGETALTDVIVGEAGKQLQIVGLSFSTDTESVIVLESVIGSVSSILMGYALPDNGTYSEQMEKDTPVMVLPEGASLALTLSVAPSKAYGKIQYRFR